MCSTHNLSVKISVVITVVISVEISVVISFVIPVVVLDDSLDVYKKKCFLFNFKRKWLKTVFWTF